MTTVVLFGPPLPGRDLLEHALARALPAGTRVESTDLPTAAERRGRAADLAAAGERTIFVALQPTAQKAWNEIHHHFSGMPARLAELRWQAFLDDAARREPAGAEVMPVIVVHDDTPLESVIADVVQVVGPREAPPPSRPRRVLVVDDDPAQLAVVEEALTELGCVVTASSSAEEALQRLAEQDFDLVVSDQRMPGAHGTDLAAALSAMRPGLRVAIMTAFPADAAEKLERGPNVDVVLAKPIGIVDLVHLVDEMART